jgi:hypothetical protein
MIIAIYIALCLAVSLALALFGFFVGRCSRKLPMLDEHLPRVLYRGQLPPSDPPTASESATRTTRRPENNLHFPGRSWMPLSGLPSPRFKPGSGDAYFMPAIVSRPYTPEPPAQVLKRAAASRYMNTQQFLDAR